MQSITTITLAFILFTYNESLLQGRETYCFSLGVLMTDPFDIKKGGDILFFRRKTILVNFQNTINKKITTL